MVHTTKGEERCLVTDHNLFVFVLLLFDPEAFKTWKNTIKQLNDFFGTVKGLSKVSSWLCVQKLHHCISNSRFFSGFGSYIIFPYQGILFSKENTPNKKWQLYHNCPEVLREVGFDQPKILLYLFWRRPFLKPRLWAIVWTGPCPETRTCRSWNSVNILSGEWAITTCIIINEKKYLQCARVFFFVWWLNRSLQ